MYDEEMSNVDRKYYTHTIWYFHRDAVHSSLDGSRACLLRGGVDPLILQPQWLILHYQLRENIEGKLIL